MWLTCEARVDSAIYIDTAQYHGLIIKVTLLLPDLASLKETMNYKDSKVGIEF